MDSKKIGSLRVEVFRRDVRFVNEAAGISICFAAICSVVGSIRDDLRLFPQQSVQRKYRPGMYNVVVYTFDLMGFASKVGMLLGVPIDISPLAKYLISRIGKGPNEMGIMDVIACYEGTQYFEGLLLATEKSEFETDALNAVKFAASHIPTKGWFYIEDDQKPHADPPKPPQVARALEEPKQTYKDSYQDNEGGLLSRLFGRRKTHA